MLNDYAGKISSPKRKRKVRGIAVRILFSLSLAFLSFQGARLGVNYLDHKQHLDAYHLLKSINSDISQFEKLYTNAGQPLLLPDTPNWLSISQASWLLLDAQEASEHTYQNELFILGKRRHIILSKVSQLLCEQVQAANNRPLMKAHAIRDGVMHMLESAQQHSPRCYLQSWKGEVPGIFWDLNEVENKQSFVLFQLLPPVKPSVLTTEQKNIEI